MGIVIRFPKRRRHARTFSRRAANSVRTAEDTPADRAFSVARIDDHHSGGIQSRCHHLVTIPGDAPISDAKAIREACAPFGPHSSMTDLNEVILPMPCILGHSVLKRKGFLSLDARRSLGHNVRMDGAESKAQFNQAFTMRVKEAREARGLTQAQMGEALGMAQDTYKQYEGRSLLPHHLIGRFCIIAQIDPEWLMTGRGKKPLRPPPPDEPEERPVQRTRKSRRKTNRVPKRNYGIPA